MIQANSKEQYEQWVRDHATELYRFACRLCGRSDAAEDLVQETFYHAWQSKGKLRDSSKARAWLYQILRYRYSHWVRDQMKRPRGSLPVEEAAGTIDTATTGPLDSMAERDELDVALARLDDHFKVPFLMVFLEGLTCRETAEQLDIPLGTVLSRIHRARKQLREFLEDRSDDSQPSYRIGGGA